MSKTTEVDAGTVEAQAIYLLHARGQNDTSPQKPRLQKDEGEENSPSSSIGKEEGSSKASMKDFLEQANRMLQSLTTSVSTTSSTTTSESEPRDEVADRLQQQLNSLRLKTSSSAKWLLATVKDLWVQEPLMALCQSS